MSCGGCVTAVVDSKKFYTLMMLFPTWSMFMRRDNYGLSFI